jgi:hypothetical protein
VNHGGHVGYQEGAGEPTKHAQQSGGPSQFKIQESDFVSNSKVQDHLTFKLMYMMCLSSDLGDLYMHGKIMI